MLLQQTLEALDYLHDLDITHRDIKPQNILMKRRGKEFHIKLADFGLSNDVTSLKTWCGTGVYVAPEIWKIRARPTAYTNKVDIWSLGVVMLEVHRAIQINAHSAGLEWCQRVAQTIQKLIYRGAAASMPLLAEMLRLDECERLSAKRCLQKFQDMGLGHSNWEISESGWESSSDIGSVIVSEGSLTEEDVVDDASETGSSTPRARSPQLLRPSKRKLSSKQSCLMREVGVGAKGDGLPPISHKVNTRRKLGRSADKRRTTL